MRLLACALCSVFSGLSLASTACFAFVDFDLQDGGGASPTSGGAGASVVSATSTGPGGAGGEGGGPPCLPSTDFTSDPEHCGMCNHDCEGGDCVNSVCRAAPLVDAEGVIRRIAVNGGNVAFVDEDNAKVCMRGADGTGSSHCMGSAAADWDGGGVGLTVADNGVVFYSPKAATSTNPIFRCDPQQADCEEAFLIGAAIPRPIDAMIALGPDVFAVSPEDGSVWRGSTTDSSMPAVKVFSVESTVGPVAGSGSIAARGGRVGVSSWGRTTANGPCIGVGSAADLFDPDPNDVLSCEELNPAHSSPSSLALTENGTAFARIFIAGEGGLTLRNGAPVFGAFKVVADLTPAKTLGGLDVDDMHVHFFGDLDPGPADELSLLRCDVGGGGNCVAISDPLPQVGPVAGNGKYVFFASGSTLYRVVR